jgi:hypothetical protein
MIMSNSNFFPHLAKTGDILGRGLIAGLAGTLAITVSQMIEMKITKREASSSPVKVGGDVLGVEPAGLADQEKEKIKTGKSSKDLEQEVEANKQKFGQLIHLGYGTAWGVARGVMDLAGVGGLPATTLHFGAVWGTALAMLPSTGASEPITKWTPKQIAIDVLHHAVYAIAAGIVYDGMAKAKH